MCDFHSVLCTGFIKAKLDGGPVVTVWWPIRGDRNLTRSVVPRRNGRTDGHWNGLVYCSKESHCLSYYRFSKS
jgi:hypothetical protein